MLFVRASGGPTETGRVAWRGTTRALPYAARGLPVGLLGGLVGLAVLPPGFVVLSGGPDFFGAVVASSLIGAAAVALAVEDPAGETLSASPTSLGRRRVLRLVTLAGTLAATWGVVLTMVALARPATSTVLTQRSAEAAATAGVALAAAGLAHRRAATGAGTVGAVAGPLALLTISAFAQRFRELPTLAAPEQHGRWWLLALAGWTVALWTWRDPARSLGLVASGRRRQRALPRRPGRGPGHPCPRWRTCG